MNNLEVNLEKLKEVLEPITKNMTFGRKQYVNKLFAEIILTVNEGEMKHENFKAKMLGFSTFDEYIDSLTKAIAFLQCLGMVHIDFQFSKKEIIEWMIDHNQELGKQMTVNQMLNTHRMVAHYQLFNDDKLPVTYAELKKYVEDLKND
jgi:hypothetical protein